MAHFFAVEAKQLWSYEQGKEFLPTIAASCLLHSLHMIEGRDKAGYPYLVAGMRMAEDFGLFRKKAAPPLYDIKDSRRYRGQAVIAWGIYTHAM
jgi:hypothetical protein